MDDTTRTELPGLPVWRKAAGLKQADLAKILGVDADSVGRWERGKRFPQVPISTIARALDCAPADLFTDRDTGRKEVEEMRSFPQLE